jgi:hypothetical protein
VEGAWLNRRRGRYFVGHYSETPEIPSGLVIWGNVEESAPERRVEGVTRDQLRQLFDAVARRDVAFVESFLDDVASDSRP